MSKTIETIYDKDHNPVCKTRYMARVRMYASVYKVKEIRISNAIYNASGSLFVLFHNGAYFRKHFNSYKELKMFVRRWRNAYGAQLYINRRGSGKVSYDNEKLIK